jgi:hypothetical protein
MMGRTMFRRALYLCTIFASSLLLFLIQPLIGKFLLPLYGGSAGVWTTVMLFFQVTLLLGYLYGHLTTRYLRAPIQVVLHVGLLAATLVLPFPRALAWTPARSLSPAIHILALMAATIGLPFLLLSSTGPLVQAWWAGLDKTRSPYRLFALSNLASLAALFSYPILIEPHFPIWRQFMLWLRGYGVFAVLAAASRIVSRGAPGKTTTALHFGALSGQSAAVAPTAPLYGVPPGETTTATEPTWRDRLMWLALAACPAALWMGMAHALSQNVAPVPLLWVLPLGVYLLSFILCFEAEGWYRPATYRIALPVSWIILGGGLVRQNAAIGLKWLVAAALAALLACCMFCHGELARRKPHASHLTAFYLWVALGGAGGGLFVALIAPGLFDQLLEFPIAVAACAVLAMGLLYGLPPRRVARLAIVGTVAFVIAAQVNDLEDGTRLRRRNFYGSLQVTEAGSVGSRMRVLSSGAIRHGSQFLAPDRSRIPTSYYGERSGAAEAIRSLGARPLRVGIIGLGAGTLAAYAKPGDSYRFYELNPDVIEVARSEFRYLAECRGGVDVVQGDGRLGMVRERYRSFDAIVLDAFSGDSIPVHLLTREAFRIYFARLDRDGMLAVHITNRYADLEPVVRGLAADAGRGAITLRSPEDPMLGTYEAVWVLVTPGPAVADGKAGLVWTDEFSNVFSVLR